MTQIREPSGDLDDLTNVRTPSTVANRRSQRKCAVARCAELGVWR